MRQREFDVDQTRELQATASYLKRALKAWTDVQLGANGRFGLRSRRLRWLLTIGEDRMQRRNAVIALVALGALPRVLMAQPQRAARIGILATLPPSNSYVGRWWTAFYAELKARGWEEGRNLVVEARYTQGHTERYSTFTDELITASVDLIVATDSQAVEAARKATRTIPNVMTNISHPVEAGYVTSLAHPGGNITGVTVDRELGDGESRDDPVPV